MGSPSISLQERETSERTNKIRTIEKDIGRVRPRPLNSGRCSQMSKIGVIDENGSRFK